MPEYTGTCEAQFQLGPTHNVNRLLNVTHIILTYDSKEGMFKLILRSGQS